jgi:outer membrane protein assembly factor BamA
VNKIYIFILTLFALWTVEIKSQPQDSAKYVVDSVIAENDIRIFIEQIVVTGNKVTEAEIILREMHSKENEYTTVEVLNRDLQRIYNLGLFTKVDMAPLPSSDKGYSLLITVEESFYILPIPIGGIKEGDLKKIWVGMNLKWRNFRGRNENLGLAFGVFYNPFINLSYSVPWIGKHDHYFTSLDVGYSLNNNKSVISSGNAPLNINDAQSYKTFNWNARASIGKYIFKELSNSISLGFNSTSTSDYIIGKTLSTSGTDNYLSMGYNIDYDTRDSYEYTLAGASISATI